MWCPLKNRMPQNFTIGNFGHPVSKSWLGPCIKCLLTWTYFHGSTSCRMGAILLGFSALLGEATTTLAGLGNLGAGLGGASIGLASSGASGWITSTPSGISSSSGMENRSHIANNNLLQRRTSSSSGMENRSHIANNNLLERRTSSSSGMENRSHIANNNLQEWRTEVI